MTVNTSFAPANVALKVTGTVMVTAVPAPVTVTPATSIAHWLFCRTAPVPGVTGPRYTLASSLVKKAPV